jgi:large subunit ribosomal protein L29
MAKALKASELVQMSDDQLQLTYKDTVKQLFQLRCQSSTERLDAASEARKAKRDIARILTVQRQRELAKAKQAGATKK